jgi:hypothetical protein
MHRKLERQIAIETESECQDRFVSLVGGTSRANELMRIWSNSYPHGSEYDRMMRNGFALTKEQVFERTALSRGFTKRQISAFYSI